ncbi:Oxidoreductase AflY 1 [Colletotrichum truncatum]|uniref:Oxidoreductase AflY 1 n=1 Tax=Colletotrichum truncatum TaxID=5467 RepID=A0ACC3YS77_COLTU
MATSSRIKISPENTGLWNIRQSEEAAVKAGELLEKDLKSHHVFLNDVGFHDHMPHHILALYGTGASVAHLQKAFDLRHPLQRPPVPQHGDVVSDLVAHRDHTTPYLGKEEHYADFLAYFQRVIDKQGYQSVVKEHLFARDTAADDLLVRLHAGVLHPLIQLMYGLEWEQPAIVAEGLAQTCVHNIEGLDELLLASERQAATATPRTMRFPSLLSMYEHVRADPKLSTAVRVGDENKIEDGILKRAKGPMIDILSQIHVDPEDLEERTAEMFHTMVLVASSAAIHPPHHVKYDFFLMHHINSSLMYLTINAQPWISLSDKVRMLEWKIRMDLLQYAARGCPPISLDGIKTYEPKAPSDESVRDIGKRLEDFGDDGHAIKQARATAICHELMKTYKDKPWAVLNGDEIWKKIQHMVVDAVEGPGVLYVRSAGLEEVWKDVPHQSAPKRAPEVLRALQTGSGSSEEALKSS